MDIENILFDHWILLFCHRGFDATMNFQSVLAKLHLGSCHTWLNPESSPLGMNPSADAGTHLFLTSIV